MMTSFSFLFPEHEEKLSPKIAAGEHVREEVQRVVQTQQKPLEIQLEVSYLKHASMIVVEP